VKNYTTGESESGCEFQLADYMGDVKRILTVRAAAIPSGQSIEGGALRCYGIVDYNILYVDTEGKLTNISTASDYDVPLPCERECENADNYFSEVLASGFSVRLTGPRKLNLRSKVSAICTLSSNTDCERTDVKIDEEENAERLLKNIKQERCLFSAPKEREYAEVAAELEEVDADGLTVLYTSGEFKANESLIVDGGIEVRGELIITSIVETDNQPPFAIRKIIPVDELINLENIPEGSYASADGYVTSATVGAANSDGGCTVSASAILMLCAVVGYNEEKTVTEDAYIVGASSEVEYVSEEAHQLLDMGRHEACVEIDVKRADTGYENVREVLVGSSDVKSSYTEVRSDGIYLLGEIAVSCVACEINDDSSITYIPIKAASEFEEKIVDCNTQNEKIKVVCIAKGGIVSTAISEESIKLVCPIYVSYKVHGESVIKRVESCIKAQSTDSEEKRKITVYYPEANETLFEIGKKYKKSVLKICSDNSLSESCMQSKGSNASLIGVERLIIR